MKAILLCLAALFLMQAFPSAQTTATWLGGTPGRLCDWNNPYNWSEGRVPDENAQVIIPSDCQYYPVIKSDVSDIDALLVAGGAKLMLDSGASLTILGESGRFDGLTVYGVIMNEGKLHAEITTPSSAEITDKIIGNGTCFIAGHFTYDEVAQK